VNVPIRPAIGAPISRPGSNGLRWWTQSISWLFGDVTRLGIWIGMVLCFFLVLAAMQWFPVLGSLAAHLLAFVFSGGLMVAAQVTQRGLVPRFADLFGGFGPQGGALVGAALLILVAVLAVWGLMLAVGAGAFVATLASSGSWQDYEAPTLAAMRIGWVSALLLLGCLLLLVPISMAAWLAPALIMLRGANPVDALRLSLSACWRNMGALTVYGLVGVGLAILASLPLLTGWFILVPLMFLSTYAAFHDIFGDGVEVLDAHTEEGSAY